MGIRNRKRERKRTRKRSENAWSWVGTAEECAFPLTPDPIFRLRLGLRVRVRGEYRA